jgi:hypothetical protein
LASASEANKLIKEEILLVPEIKNGRSNA